MEGRPNNKNKITKTRDFPWKNTKKLGYSKNINRKGKKIMNKQFDKKR